MREIKFRVWSGSMWLDGNDANIQPIDPDSTTIELEASSPHQKHIMCQYTGLKDKNGKECFEGDRVKNRLTEHHGTVVYTDEFATFNVVDEKGKWVCSMGAMGSDGFEITGNIYESK